MCRSVVVPVQGAHGIVNRTVRLWEHVYAIWGQLREDLCEMGAQHGWIAEFGAALPEAEH